jgi:hypothetical protein
MACATLKMVVLAPMPSPSVKIVTRANPGDLRRVRNERRKSCARSMLLILASPDSKCAIAASAAQPTTVARHSPIIGRLIWQKEKDFADRGLARVSKKQEALFQNSTIAVGRRPYRSECSFTVSSAAAIQRRAKSLDAAISGCFSRWDAKRHPQLVGRLSLLLTCISSYSARLNAPPLTRTEMSPEAAGWAFQDQYPGPLIPLSTL